MTQDEIIEMAQECNLIGMRPHLDGIYSESLVAFANLVAAKALAQPVSSHGNAEDLYVEMSKHLNCPHCGGSGHIDDVAQPEQEPFAYVNVEKRRLEFAHDYVKWDTPTTIKLDKIPLYTTPPQRTWVGLTKEQLATTDWSADFRAGALWAEAKLKERNT